MRPKSRILLAILIILAPVLFGFFSAMADDVLNELNPDEPIYQKIWGGTVIAWPAGDVDEVRLPDPKTTDQAKLEAEIERIKADTQAYKDKLTQNKEQREDGHFWIKAGAGAFVLGAFMFVALMKYGIEWAGILAAASGLGSICYGALIIKLAGMETIIAWGAVALFITGIAAWFCKGNNIVEKINQIRNKTEA